MSAEEVRPAQRILAEPTAEPYERIFFAIVIASCVLHVGLAFIATISPRPRLVNAVPGSVAVEILAPEEFEALSGRLAARPAAIPEPTVDPAKGMIHATRLYAAAALAEPGSRQAREVLPTLREDERILQLCNLEAIEQVGRWSADLEPEFVVAYAIADAEIANDRVRADGGAFRSRDHWYRIRFACAVSHDHDAIVDFAFSVGEEIPESQWEIFGLTADTGVDDQ